VACRTVPLLHSTAALHCCALLPPLLLAGTPFQHRHNAAQHCFPGLLTTAPLGLSPPCLQPLDALATVLEGGLLGASDTGYLGARTAASCCVSLVVLGVASHLHGNLLAVWVGMKAITGCTLALDLGKFLVYGAKQGAPLAPPPAAPAKRRKGA